MNTYIDHDNNIREKTFMMMVPLLALAGLLWSIMYYVYGAKTSALIPGCYALISFSSLLFYRLHKNFHVFRTIQLLLILLLPALLQLYLGDFVSSSAVIMWSSLCPLGALAFHNSKAAVYWLLLFLGVLVLVFVLEDRLFPVDTKLPASLVTILFVMNIASVTFLSFHALRYFVNQNELVKDKLKLEQDLLAAEREKSEKLLLNILPSLVAKRLKDGETVIANEYAEAAVLFADITGFTNISQHISPDTLVNNLNKIFTHFDMLAEKYDIEKIKTIGDSYMVASGLTEFKSEHAKHMADFALAIAGSIHEFSLDGKSTCDIRIGIHIGPVIAGVIGSKKFSYDIWGDAVNTASRMESSGESGKIQISERFYEHIKDDYECSHRGQMEIRGKGRMNLYFLVSKKTHKTANQISPVGADRSISTKHTN